MDGSSALILMSYYIGIGLGVGSTAAAGVFLVKFLNNFQLSQRESVIILVFSKIIWFATAITIITSAIIYMSQAWMFNQRPAVLITLAISAVIFINHLIWDFFVFPKLARINSSNALRYNRRLALAMTSISFTSWCFIFIFVLTPTTVLFTSNQFIAIYLITVGDAVFLSQLFERFMPKRI